MAASTRARVSRLTPGHRSEFTQRAATLVEELSSAAPGLPGPATEAALALADGAEVIVLCGTEQLPGVREREMADALSADLATRGATVVVLGRDVEPAPARHQRTDALAGSAAGGSDE